jgi:tRNA-dihydrouridine synthase A
MQREISIAPMVDISTIYFRQLLRLMSNNLKIYTEMLSSSQLTNSEYDISNLYIHPNERPIIGQLGGSDPETMAKAGFLLQSQGFSEININCGCPSCKVKEGSFGACLMLNPDLVRRICSEIRSQVQIPLTVKCRIGVDNHDTYPELLSFIDTVRQSGVNEFVIHARKAILKGLSPADNRRIPPLRYNWVYDLQKDFPSLKFHINGGITSHFMIQDNLSRGLGVMIGRLSYEDPYFFSKIDSLYFNTEDPIHTRKELLLAYAGACEDIQQGLGKRSNKVLMTKPIVNLFKNQRGSNPYRVMLDKASKDKNITFTQGVDMVIEKMEEINQEALNS